MRFSSAALVALALSMACTTVDEPTPAAKPSPTAKPSPKAEPAPPEPVTPIVITPGVVDEATYRRVMTTVIDGIEADVQAWATQEFSSKEEGGQALAALLAPAPGRQQRFLKVMEELNVDFTGFGQFLQANPEAVARMKAEIDQRLEDMQKTPAHLAQIEKLNAMGD